MAPTPLPKISFRPEPPADPDAKPVTLACHCGRVSVTIPHPPRRMNECHCGACYKYGILWAYYWRRDVTITGETRLYVREDKDAGGDIAFGHCVHCGCVTHWEGVKDTERRKRVGPDAAMAVNCRLFPEEAIEGIERIATRR